MLRGSMPALTVVVFVIGTGIGLSWSRGFIPVAITPPKTGSLSPEYSKREPLPPPPDLTLNLSSFQNNAGQGNSSPEENELIKNQTEPDFGESDNATSDATRDQDRSATASLTRTADVAAAVDVVEQALADEARPVVRLGKRGRKAIRLSSESDVADDAPSEKLRKVVAAAHQDPGDASNDTRDASREDGRSGVSPRELLTVAEEKLANGDTLKAHRDLSTIYWNHKEFRPQIQEIIDSTAKAIFFQSKPHYLDPYTIQEGERLEVIAKKYHLSWEYLAKLNRTNPKRIQVGQKLKVVKGPFGAVVDLKDFDLTVHLQGYYVKRYEIGIGKDNSSPIGEFAVLSKVENPEYTDGRTGKTIKGDDPTNPLGKRWIDLGDSYGIHGTIDPQSIGKAESRGCIRLGDNDIIEVYDFLVKGSKVVLR